MEMGKTGKTGKTGKIWEDRSGKAVGKIWSKFEIIEKLE